MTIIKSIFSSIMSLFGGDKPTKDTRALCFGMGNSKSAGSCPGAVLDATRMSDLLSKYATAGVVKLLDSQATYSAAKIAMLEAVTHKLAIIFYSGHGGRDSKDGNASGEDDRRDEYLCFYDRMMKDDEVWYIVSQAKGRVVLIFDCCHSGTMYRALEIDKDDAGDSVASRTMSVGSYPFTLSRFREWLDGERRDADRLAEAQKLVGMSRDEIGRIRDRSIEAIASATPNLLVWSAAREFEYSYGGNTGGIFTNALLSAYRDKKTYDKTWNRIKVLMRGEPNVPVKTVFGSGFDCKVFR
jgi:hypothetical protein